MIGEYVAPSVKVYENVLPNADEFITFAVNRPEERWTPSYVGGDKKLVTGMRNSREFSMKYGLNEPKMFFDLAHIIFQATKLYADENGFRFSLMEPVTMLEYLPNQGFYDLHVDAGPSHPRVCSALLYLNDVDEGGETWFDKQGLKIKPEKGKLIVFPASYAYSHQAMPPVSGNKYVAVTWFGQVLDRDIFERYYK